MNKKLHSLILVALVVACSRQPKLEAIQGYALGTTYGIQYQAIEEEKKLYNKELTQFSTSLIAPCLPTFQILIFLR